METATVAFDRSEARALFREYRKHLHWSAPIDHEIRRTYQFIAQGRVVIRALESVKAAGVYDRGRGRRVPEARALPRRRDQLRLHHGLAGQLHHDARRHASAHSLARRRRADQLAQHHDLAGRLIPGQSERALLARRRSCPDAAAASAAAARAGELSRFCSKRSGARRRPTTPCFCAELVEAICGWSSPVGI